MGVVSQWEEGDGACNEGGEVGRWCRQDGRGQCEEQRGLVERVGSVG